jgi:hypothetical protein
LVGIKSDRLHRLLNKLFELGSLQLRPGKHGSQIRGDHGQIIFVDFIGQLFLENQSDFFN